MASRNMAAMSVAAPMSHLEMSWLKAALSNMLDMSVTAETFHDDMSWLKAV